MSWTAGHKKFVDPSKWPQDLIWQDLTRLLRYVYPSDNWKCLQNTFFVFWGLINTKLLGFLYVRNQQSYKNGWPFKMTTKIDLQWAFWDMYTPQQTTNRKFSQNAIFCFFRPYIKKFLKFQKLFLFTFLVLIFMVFLVQKLIYTINIWSNFVFGWFFEQDHLLNLFIFGVYAKRWPKCALISIQKLM